MRNLLFDLPIEADQPLVFRVERRLRIQLEQQNVLPLKARLDRNQILKTVQQQPRRHQQPQR